MDGAKNMRPTVPALPIPVRPNQAPFRPYLIRGSNAYDDLGRDALLIAASSLEKALSY